VGTLDPLVSHGPVILFDGVCNLCNGAVQFIIRRDKKNVFRFASLQSDPAKKMMASAGLPPDKLDSIIVIKNNRVYRESDAAIEIAKEFSGGWKLLSWFGIFPKIVRDPAYRLIARYRYRLFGKRDICMIPTPDLKSKFL
jgi:predicted DCC family thiol-disulfide oxidoreductase YuxK